MPGGITEPWGTFRISRKTNDLALLKKFAVAKSKK
jgi:hypothetical protein